MNFWKTALIGSSVSGLFLCLVWGVEGDTAKMIYYGFSSVAMALWLVAYILHDIQKAIAENKRKEQDA